MLCHCLFQLLMISVLTDQDSLSLPLQIKSERPQRQFDVSKGKGVNKKQKSKPTKSEIQFREEFSDNYPQSSAWERITSHYIKKGVKIGNDKPLNKNRIKEINTTSSRVKEIKDTADTLVKTQATSKDTLDLKALVA